MESFVNYLVESNLVSMSKRGGIVVSGKPVNPRLAKSLLSSIEKQVLSDHGLLIESLDNPEVFVFKLEKELRRHFYEKNKLNFTGQDLPESDFDISKLRYVMDMTTAKEHLYNTDIRQISKLSVDALKKILPPETKNQFFSNATPSIFSFDPYDVAAMRSVPFEGMTLTQFNLYAPPSWMEADEDGKHLVGASDVQLPDIVHEFMEHLFPDKRARMFVWGWMHEALVGRAETYLVLNGKKGLGKGLFSEKLLECLVGADNFKIAPESLLTSDFNAALDKGRMVILDEFKVDTDLKLNKLKRYINARQTIERKGVDADKVITTYNSFVISNNDILDMRVMWDDRRFSVMDLNSVPLRKVWRQSKIDDFVKLMGTPEFQRNFGYYVLYYGKQEKQDAFSFYVGEHFHKIVYNSLSEWERALVDIILSNQSYEYDMREVKALYKTRVENGKFPVKPQRIKDFLSNYLHEGKHILGRLVEEGGSQTIYAGEYFCPNTNAEEISGDFL